MSNFDRAMDIILDEEGGYNNDPNDPGGETKFGISKRTYPDVDIKNLTRDGAKLLYKRDFWDQVSGDELPWPLCLYVGDAAINQGVKPAISMLQHALDTVQDGILGRVTLKRAKDSHEWHWSRFMAFRAMRYQGTRNFDRFGEGWLIRLFNVAAHA